MFYPLPCPHLSPEPVIAWTCPWVGAFPFLGYIILYSSLKSILDFKERVVLGGVVLWISTGRISKRSDF